jgi:hypothetical protein
MRLKYLAQLDRAPANCNHKGPPQAPVQRDGRSSAGETRDPRDDQRDRTDCFKYRGWDRCASCARREEIARRHQARLMWLLAREFCASAACHGLEGRVSAASRTLHLASTVLCDRAGILGAERGGD